MIWEYPYYWKYPYHDFIMTSWWFIWPTPAALVAPQYTMQFHPWPAPHHSLYAAPRTARPRSWYLSKSKSRWKFLGKNLWWNQFTPMSMRLWSMYLYVYIYINKMDGVMMASTSAVHDSYKLQMDLYSRSIVLPFWFEYACKVFDLQLGHSTEDVPFLPTSRLQ